MATQYDLYDGLPPHQNTDTSLAAALSVLPNCAQVRERVFRFIAGRGRYGATDDEAERSLSVRHQTVSARRRELVLLGRVIASGLTRRTSSGRHAQVWTAVGRA